MPRMTLVYDQNDIQRLILADVAKNYSGKEGKLTGEIERINVHVDVVDKDRSFGGKD